MTNDLDGVAEYVSETAEGHATVIAALVMTLHKAGTLPLDSFRETLHKIRATMPEDEAESETGVVIEQMIDFLNSNACSNPPIIDETQSPEKAPDADTPLPGDAIAVPPTNRFARFVQTTFEAASRPWSDASGSTKHGNFRTVSAGRM